MAGGSNSTDPQIQSALQGGSVGAPPQVPGYSGSSGSSPAGVTAQGQTISVAGYTLSLTNGVKPTDQMEIGFLPGDTSTLRHDTVASVLQQFATWTQDQYQKFRLQAYQAGLTSSKTASKAEVVTAWQTVVEEAAKQKKDPGTLIQQAVDQGGWNKINPNIMPGDNGLPGTGNANNQTDTSSTSQTTYVSYMDPATAQGTLADAYFRLLGRNPTSAEYQAFLNSLYSYQNDENTGKFETKSSTPSSTVDPATGQVSNSSDVNTNIISQRGIATRGAQFFAGQDAMANPEEGTYQAATTYSNAFIKALGGPAAGMQASGPTVTAP